MNAFGNVSAAGIVKADNRSSDFHSEVENFAYLFADDLSERAASDREILSENKNFSAVDRAVTGDYAVADSRISAVCAAESVDLFKAAAVKKFRDPFTRRELPFCVLRFDPFFAAAELSFLFLGSESS